MTQYIFAKRGYNGVTRVDMEDYFDDVELESLYQWIDRVPLSRPKKNLGKDFSDGVLVGEIIKHYFPRLVDLHNYTPAAATKQKMENWFLLNSPKPTTVTGTELVPYHPAKSGMKSPRAGSIIGGVPHGHPLRASYSTRPAVLTVAPITDNVSKAMLEEKELECMAKDETIQILNAKLKRMEQLLHLKDIRIDDLESRMNHIQALKLAQYTDGTKLN
ncbi:sperm flagellar protein 1 [Plakobranchus ocellatus]|uniref:Sperm flagellar protein 1 n=1 Tax=Plakobranchus ocellatus TaxID=259542 RepID=A0AAV4BA90_9GAST|nr:sperm flagellar protein 1 [Plakobranchus ocellatus]